jgi:hypothetical protein
VQTLSTAQKEHLKHGGRVSVSIAVDPVSGDPFTLGSENIRKGTLKIDRNWTQGRVLEIGCADTSELSFTLENGTGQWSTIRWEGARLTVNLHFGGGSIPAGVFTVDEPPRMLTTIRIRALDGMAKFNRPYSTDLVFPATLLQVIQEVCSKCNVTLHTLDFENKDYVVQEKPAGDDITFHLVVSWVAQLAGCNAWMDWLDQLRLTWYGDVQSGSLEIGPDDRYSYEAAEADVTITGIILRTGDTDYLVGTEVYSLVIEGNPLLQSNHVAVLQAIYNKIGGFTYRPFKFSVLGRPHLWPGDVITHLVDAEGNQLTSIITNHSYTLNGKSELAAKGETETVRGHATGAPFTSTQKRVLQSIAQVETARQTTPLEQATLHLNELMANALGLYPTVIEQPSGAKLFYMHNQPTLEDSQLIWHWTEQGLAWTDQGWQGGSPNWHYGLMTNGNAVLRVLSTLGINADWINAGSISAERLTIGSGTTFAPGFDPSTKATPEWVASRGENLVTNGTGMLGNNTNFSPFVFDGAKAHNSSGSFKHFGPGTRFTDEFMPINVEQRYLLSMDAKTLGGTGRYFSMVATFDVDNHLILAPHHMFRANTLTALAQELKTGDTVVHLTDASNWDNSGTAGVATSRRSIILWNYVNSFGYQYPALTYSRNWTNNAWDPGAIDFENNTITLRVPWAEGTVPVGTQLSNGNSGAGYKYLIDAVVPTTWTHYSGIISGVDFSGTNRLDMFPPGTATARVGWLMNHGGTGETIWVTNVSLGVDIETTAGAQAKAAAAQAAAQAHADQAAAAAQAAAEEYATRQFNAVNLRVNDMEFGVTAIQETIDGHGQRLQSAETTLSMHAQGLQIVVTQEGLRTALEDLEEDLQGYADGAADGAAGAARSAAIAAAIHQVDGKYGQTHENVNSHFSFTAQGLAIGRTGSQLQVTISNEEIGFWNGGVRVAYINGQKLYITESEILNAIKVGRHRLWKDPGDPDITLVGWVG